MAPEVDPFLTLGVPPGASLNEIKSAYRRLAKQYHPDTAGERALPRFLAIQAAYERLVDGEGRLRPPPDPWRASAARSAPGGRPRASRDAWRARRSSSTAGTGPATGGQRPSGSRSGAGGEGSGAAADPGAEAGQGERRQDGERTRYRRGPRTATPGSTTYDEAAERVREPESDGRSWYEPSMGTFWTINPKEYADPRKHGPEYLARARRTTGPAGSGDEAPASSGAAPAAAPEPATDADAAEGDWAWSGRAETTTGGDTADWAARSWTYDTRDAGPTWTAGSEPGRRPGFQRGPAASAQPVADAPPLPDLETLLRRASPASLLARVRSGSRGWRLGIALLAWLPIAYIISTVVLDATGCSTYAATCPEEVRWPMLLAQALVIGVLYALPVVSASGAFATLAGLAVAFPVAALFSVGAGPKPQIASTILNAAVLGTWAIAFAAAAWWLSRRGRTTDAGS